MRIASRALAASRLGEAQSESEVGELGFSLGIVSGRLVLNQSRWQRIRSAFRQPTLDQMISIPGADSFIHVRAIDDAAIDVYLRVANYSAKPLVVESVSADWVGVASHGVEANAPRLLYSLPSIGVREVGAVHLRMTLMPGGVRELLTALQPSPNKLSSPRADLQVRGAMVVTQEKDRAQLRFDLRVPTPNWSVAKGVADSLESGAV